MEKYPEGGGSLIKCLETRNRTRNMPSTQSTEPELFILDIKGLTGQGDIRFQFFFHTYNLARPPFLFMDTL